MPREPFKDLPPDCDTIEFDTNIGIEDFPVCEVPPIVTPPAPSPMSYAILPPALDIPPVCTCIPPVKKEGTILVNEGIWQVEYTIKLWQKNEDCCCPELELSYDVQVPCMPLAITNDGTAENPLDPPLYVPEDGLDEYKEDLFINITKEEGCVLNYNYDLKVIGISGTRRFVKDLRWNRSLPGLQAQYVTMKYHKGRCYKIEDSDTWETLFSGVYC
jgi:hypothetical protein